MVQVHLDAPHHARLWDLGIFSLGHKGDAMTKILALILAGALASLTLASCTGKAEDSGESAAE